MQWLKNKKLLEKWQRLHNHRNEWRRKIAPELDSTGSSYLSQRVRNKPHCVVIGNTANMSS